jgi:hypothetical protein
VRPTAAVADHEASAATRAQDRDRLTLS